MQFDAAEHLSQIIALLRVRTGHDFGGYKSRTWGAVFSGVCRRCRSITSQLTTT